MDREAMIAALIFGGSGGGGLPAVTSSDNGKSLKVVSGAWAAADDEFVVTFTKNGSVWSADKGEDEIKAAITAKKRVFGKVNGSSITEDNNIKMYTVIVPLEGTSASHGTVFGGALQSVTNTIFCTFIVYGLVVTAYTKTVAIAPAPLYVNFTITGAAVDNVYPLSADKTLAEIDAAIKAGADVIGTCNIGGQDTPQARIASTKYTNGDLSFVGFTILGTVGGSPVMGVVEYDTNGASLTMIPLSTAQMTYDSGTGTLAITE